MRGALKWEAPVDFIGAVFAIDRKRFHPAPGQFEPEPIVFPKRVRHLKLKAQQRLSKAAGTGKERNAIADQDVLDQPFAFWDGHAFQLARVAHGERLGPHTIRRVRNEVDDIGNRLCHPAILRTVLKSSAPSAA